DLPGSNSFLEPVWTGMSMLTRFGNPVGTTITLRPLGSVRSVAAKGRMSLDDEARWAGDCAASAVASESSTPVEMSEHAFMWASPSSEFCLCYVSAAVHPSRIAQLPRRFSRHVKARFFG